MDKVLVLIFINLTFFTIFTKDNEFINNLVSELIKEYKSEENTPETNEKINQIKIFVNNILRNYQNVKFNDVISYETWENVKLLYGGPSCPENSFLNKINNCKTALGKIILAYKLSNPTADINELVNTQNIIKFLIRNQEIVAELDNLFDEFCSIENDIIEFFDQKSIVNNKNKNQRIMNKFYFKNRSNSNKNTKVLYFKKLITDIFTVLIKPYYSGLGTGLYLLSYFLMFDNILDNIFLKIAQIIPIPLFKEITTLVYIVPIVKALKNKKSIIAGGIFIGGIITSVFSIINVYKKIKSYRQDFKVILNKVRSLQLFFKISQSLIKVVENNQELNDFTEEKLKNVKALFLNKNNPELNAAINFLLKKNIKRNYFSTFSPSILAIFNVLKDNKNVIINSICELLELDTYLSMVKMIGKKPRDFNFTKFITPFGKPEVTIENLWNPFINDINIVKNDLKIGKNYRNMLLCGHNGGGKTTYLNSIWLNLILIQTFGISMSSYSEMTIFNKLLFVSNIKDDIHKGDSLYKAEIRKIKEFLDICKTVENTNRFVLSIFEEPLNGTDSKSTISILLGMFKYLSKHNTNIINIISTHYNKLSKLTKNYNFKNFYPDVEINENGDIKYLYKIKEGDIKKSLAIPIAKQVGIDDKIIQVIKKEYESTVE